MSMSDGNISMSHGNMSMSHGNKSMSRGNTSMSHGNTSMSHGNTSMSHGNISMSHVYQHTATTLHATHINKSCRRIINTLKNYQWVISVFAQRLECRDFMSHIWMIHVTSSKSHSKHTNESYLRTHSNSIVSTSRHVYVWVMSHNTFEKHINGSCLSAHSYPIVSISRHVWMRHVT